MYEKYLKRILDFIISSVGIIVLSPIFLVLIILGAVFMGGNPFFTQKRPGKDEKIFKLVKFRSMDNRKDKDGKLLPDEERLNKYGRFLRASSLDELPELLNIIKGDMSLVGPRPQLVRDMVFMTAEQRLRHTVMPGLSGLAQVNGRNAIAWEEKLNWDLKYIENLSFAEDARIILRTIKKAFLSHEDINEEGSATATDLGDYLLAKGLVTKEEYDLKQSEAKSLLKWQIDK